MQICEMVSGDFREKKIEKNSILMSKIKPNLNI